ncbi:hypothetical protein WA026_007844, partial [Henosepilachna vigintioctopunctata]
ASLTCLKCSDPKSCLKPKIEKCSDDVKYCASLEFRKIIGKGCMDRENICQQKSSLGQGFDHCSICQTDNYEYYNVEHHVNLIETVIFTRVKKALKRRNQIRNVCTNLTKEIKNTYYDDERNLRFDDEYLEEITEKQETYKTAND